MFKIVRDFVKQPHFAIYCDASCGVCVSGPFNAGTSQIEDHQQVLFLQEAARQGWKIGLDRQLCPGHVAKAREDQNLIVTAKMNDICPSLN